MAVNNEESNIFFRVSLRLHFLYFIRDIIAIRTRFIVNTLIVCDGRPPSNSLFEIWHNWSDYIIAADGGIHTIRSFDAVPDLAIGDMDSFDPDGSESFEVISDSDQETNDLEKALNLAVQEEATHITVLGATGQRVDHTLKNISVLKQFDSRFEELIFRDDYGDLLLLPKQYSTELPIHAALSLFPLSGVVSGIVTEGLEYPLNNEKIENGVRDGSSNRVISNPVSITHKEGDLLLFVAR